VAEATAAQDSFRVGAQNFIVADRTSIGWSTESRIPTRPSSTDFEVAADGSTTGYCPTFVLPGQGGHEWGPDLDSRFVPHDRDPARGWIATANQDNVGVTDDGNPCNDAHYIGGGFDLGWREDRIQSELTALAARGEITTADMIDLSPRDLIRGCDPLEPRPSSSSDVGSLLPCTTQG
jgi:penicillin amidase